MTPDPLLDRLEYLRDLTVTFHHATTPLRELLPHQQPPDGVWDGWIIQAGRGAGKTAGIARYVTDHVNGPACIKTGMPHKMALIAPTIGDAVESAARHPVCLKTLTPSGRLQQKPGGTIFTWPNGSEMKLFGVHTGEDVERLRAGGNNCLVWAEELAAWRLLEDGWDQMQFGLRIGPHPHWVGSSTPKHRRKFRDIIADPAVIVTRAHMDDNPHLDEAFRTRIQRMYGGTSLGRQEIAGEILEEVDGALWTPTGIDQDRLPTIDRTRLVRVVTAIDPQGTEGSGTTGIVAAGLIRQPCPCGQWLDRQPHAAILADTSLDSSPTGWARTALQTHHTFEGDRLVGERNYGGDMVESTLRAIDANAPVDVVTATRGKQQRAEPISALYQQHRIHHVGVYPELEDEMTTWTPVEGWSPNRLDALVWALTALGLSEWREARSNMNTLAGTRI